MKIIYQLIIAAILFSANICIAQQDSNFGVLVMAHGGSEQWNQGVIDTVSPLHENYNVEIAFGMADAFSIQEAVHKLEAKGSEKIAVVRLFVSGESWFERTQQILGLTDGAPERPSADPHAAHDMHPPAHRMEFWKIDSNAQFALSTQGLADAELMAQVLLTRANELSDDADKEDVLILAHGPEDDAENQRWLEKIEQRSALLHEQHSFRTVHVATLREDWKDKREAAETHVRGLVESANSSGGTALIIPFRVHGFGPYEDVFAGLDYRANQVGLIPHPAVTQWIEQQVQILDGTFHH